MSMHTRFPQVGSQTGWPKHGSIVVPVVLVAILILAACAQALPQVLPPGNIPTSPPTVAPMRAEPSPSAVPTTRAEQSPAAPPTQAPATALPSATPTEGPSAALRSVQGAMPSGGIPTVVPILYKMFDWGTDFQHSQPEVGPVGSIQFYVWEDINPAQDQYNWTKIDQGLAQESNLKVTLLDGREIPKPVVIQIMPYISSKPGWPASVDFYDATPQWVYEQIDNGDPNNPRPLVGGKRVGHALRACGKVAVLPMYDSPQWREAYYKMVRAFGARYDGNPQVTSVVINVGLDGETQPIKDWNCNWDSDYLDQQAGGARYRFNQFIYEAMRVYREAFPTKTIFINNAPGGPGIRKATSDYAATLSPPIGLKNSSLWVDRDSHQGYGEYVGMWDMLTVYSATLPIWLESVFGMGSREQRYWSLLAGLHYHPDAMDLHPEYFSSADSEFLHFVVKHLGVDIGHTPDVWTVLRDSEYPYQSWGEAAVSGHPGDWTFWLYRLDDAPGSATERVWRAAIPAAQTSDYSRQTRRTQETRGQYYMSFDVDDRYPYAGQKPVSEPEGNVYYDVHVTLLNTGNDTFALQYKNYAGDTMSIGKRKGASLGDANAWVTVDFLVLDGFFANGLPGKADFRISSERDGDEYVHMVRVEGHWGRPPTPTPTPTYGPSPTPMASRTPTATLVPTWSQPPPPPAPQATSVPVPTSWPTAVPTTVPSSTATPRPTSTFTPTPGPSPTPSNTPTITPTPSITPTPTDTLTPTAGPSPTPTDTPTASATPSSTPTSTSTPTNTSAPTSTYTVTPSPTAVPTTTSTATSLPTPTAVPTATATPQLGRCNGQIVFVTNRGASGPNVWVMNADGGNPRRLTAWNQAANPRWSPDGRIIWSEGGSLWTMNDDGGNKRYAGAEGTWCSWSPDGSQILFSQATGAGREDILVRDAAGGAARQLTSGSARNFQAVFAPDGQRIAFVSNRDHDMEIYVMDANGANQRRLTNVAGYDGGPAWAAGGQILFGSMRGGSPVERMYIMDGNGSGQRLLMTDQNGGYASLCGDGSRFVFTALVGANKEIHRANLNGSDVGNLSNDPATDESPDWQK